MAKLMVDEYGNHRWYNSNNELHREGGPAVMYSNGTQTWYLNDKVHRKDGPASIWSDGSQYWYLNGKHIGSNKDYQKAANLTDEEMTLIILKYGNVE